MRVHEQVQREVEQQAKGTSAKVKAAAEAAAADACGAEAMEADGGGSADSCQPGSSTSPPDAQPFVLPLGVMARNEVYPRSCRKW